MQEHAYDAMRTMQENHWWWRGMRRLYAAVLHRFAPDRPALRVIDIGCGFGANLPVLTPLGNVVGVDLSFEALQAIRVRPALGLVQCEADALPFRAGSFDVIALLAVIEHMEHDDIALTEAYRVACPGAIQLLCTSAFMFLWSHHDVANNHKRRYRVGQLAQLEQAAGWHVLAVKYANAFVFPGVALVRLFQRQDLPGGASEYDMGPDLGPFNRLFEVLLGFEGWLISRWKVGLPFGVDVIGIARRDP